MRNPTIGTARKLCEELGARAVIVIALDSETYAASSYGQTKRECGQTSKTLDAIVQRINSGAIPIWSSDEEGPR